LDKSAQLGTTDLKVSRHGLGAVRIGDGAPLEQIENLFDSLLDLGITFIDTADCYAPSEELIGRYLKDNAPASAWSPNVPSPMRGCCRPTRLTSTAAPTGIRFAPC